MEFPLNEGITEKRPKLAQNRYGRPTGRTKVKAFWTL